VLTQSMEKYQQILQTARQLYEQEPDWVTFFREVLGVDGMVRGSFSSLEELSAFERSPEFEQIQKWLVKLREQRTSTDSESEPTRVITVRLPKSMHEYLRTEAHDLRTSMNKLCISKLLQVIGEDMIPNERTGTGEGGNSSPSTNHSQQPVSKPQIATATLSQPTPGLSGMATHSPTPSPFKPATPRF